MTDRLERHAGRGGASFAWNADSGVPWHRLGVPVDGVQDLDTMLALAHADYDVEMVPVYVLDPRSGVPVPVDRQFATARISPHDGSYQPLGTVKGRYTVYQNRATLECALDVVQAAHGDAVFDTVGVLDDGRQFFATIDLGSLVVDPLGVDDRIARYLVVRSSHDGTTALTFSNTNIRAVCMNTCILGERQAQRVFKSKHTPKMDGRVSTAREVLRISGAWAVEFAALAEEMLAVPMTPAKFDRVIAAVLPDDEDGSLQKRRNRDDKVGLLKALYVNDRNAGRVGDNGWAAWNTVVEYFDHHRPGSVVERALTSMDDGSWVSRRKVLAQLVVMGLA